MRKHKDPDLGSTDRPLVAEDSQLTDLRSPDRLDTLTDDFARLLGRKAPKAGTIVGSKYRLVEHLGAGAMGEVWSAVNTAIDLKVAVKVLKPELLADAQFRRRFQREAQAIASITHPNVARFLDVVIGDPTFLVMEYVAGKTLKDLLELKVQLEPQRALTIAVGLARALEAVHAAGVVHRDLKPSNIMLSVDAQGDETPRVIDFGLAKVPRGANETLTQPGQVVGTPAYMSPEQTAGQPVDPRADVYALGCVLYHMLVGRPPFVGDDVEVLYKHLHGAVPSLGKIPGLPGGVAAVVSTALAKSPDRRFKSATEMRQALEWGLARARGDRRARLLRWMRTRDAKLILGGGVLAALILFAGGLLVGRRGAGPGADRSPALLIVDSSPAGARVLVDGKPLEESTPTAIRGLVPGTHQVQIQRPGSVETVRTVTTTAAGRASLNVVLAPSGKKVEVRTLPPGATLFVDDQPAANSTPATVTLSDGEFHVVRAEKAGYQTITRTLRPEDATAALDLTLVPEITPRGSVIVDADGVGEVWIDGVYTGFVTPTLALRVGVGRRLIELRDADGTLVDQVVIKVGKGETRRLYMTRGAGKR